MPFTLMMRVIFIEDALNEGPRCPPKPLNYIKPADGLEIKEKEILIENFELSIENQEQRLSLIFN